MNVSEFKKRPGVPYAFLLVFLFGWVVVAEPAWARDEKLFVSRQVLRPDGQPLVGATVRVLRDYGSSSGPPSKAMVETVTDGRGQFLVEVAGGGAWQGSLFVSADGCAITCQTAVSATELENLSVPTVLRVRPAFKIGGKVTGTDGRTIPNAEVNLVGIRPEHWNYLALNTLEPFKTVTAEFSTRSDASGHWSLPGVDIVQHSGTVDDATFDFEAVAYAPRRIARVELQTKAKEPAQPGGTLPLDFKLTLPIKIAGRIINAATGRPVQGAVLDRGMPFRRNSDEAGVTDASGRFELGVAGPVPALWFHVYCDGFATATLQTPQLKEPNSDWRDTLNLTIHLRPLVKVSGTLHDETGRPLKETVELIGAFEEKFEDARWRLTGSEGKDTHVAKDGRFSTRLPTGRIIVQLQLPPQPVSSAAMVAGMPATRYELNQKVTIAPTGQGGVELKARRISGTK